MKTINNTKTKLLVRFINLSWLLSLLIFSSHAQQLDKYGGITDLHFDDGEGKGFFRTKYIGNQWWFVTPENNAFLSYGINHFHAYLWAQDYNKGYWEGELGGTAWTEPWKDGFYEHAKEVVTKIGANSMGYHNEEKFLQDRPTILPNIRHYVPVKFSLHMNPTAKDYVDVFSPDFVQVCKEAAELQVRPYVDDEMLIGFMMADIPGLTEMWAKAVNIPTWAMVLRNLPASSPGKQKYVETMQEEFSSIDQFNGVHGTSFATWDELKTTENWRSNTDFDNANEVAANNAFNKKCMNKYYEVASEAFREVNKNHLFFGDKLNANLQDPNELDLVIDVAKDYVDVLCVQFYGHQGYQINIQNRIVSASGNVPFINGDGGFGAKGDDLMPNPQTPTAADQTERAAWFAEYAQNAFSNPNFIGWHICGVIDAWNPHGTQKAGIMNPLGEYHSDVITSLFDVRTKLYEYRGVNSDPVLDVKKTPRVEIFPNPVRDFIQLSNFELVKQVSLVDMNGKKMSITVSPDGMISFPTIERGTYMLMLGLNSGETRSQKLIINGGLN